MPKKEEPSSDPTPEELEDVKLACAKLWALDRRLALGSDYKLNVGDGQ